MEKEIFFNIKKNQYIAFVEAGNKQMSTYSWK